MVIRFRSCIPSHVPSCPPLTPPTLPQMQLFCCLTQSSAPPCFPPFPRILIVPCCLPFGTSLKVAPLPLGSPLQPLCCLAPSDEQQLELHPSHGSSPSFPKNPFLRFLRFSLSATFLLLDSEVTSVPPAFLSQVLILTPCHPLVLTSPRPSAA